MSFFDGATLLGSATLVNGGAFVVRTLTGTGVHTLIARYDGTACVLGSADTALYQQVPNPTTTSLTALPNPSNCGSTVALRAVVTPAGSAGGPIQFRRGGTVIGTAVVGPGGEAIFTTEVEVVGDYTYVAEYLGTACYAASASPVVNHAVVPASVLLLLAAAPNPAKLGDVVRLTATLSPTGGSGSVEFFFAGGASIGVAPLGATTAVLDVPGLAEGMHRFRAVYGGDGCYQGATSVVVPVQVGAAPGLVIGDLAQFEGNSGTAFMRFPVTMTSRSQQPVTVRFTTRDGSAQGPSDYFAVSGTLTIPAGQTTAVIPVSVRGDTLIEGNESFEVVLSDPTIATLLDSVATGLVLEDDPAPPPPPPPPGLSGASGYEGDSGTTPFQFAFRSPIVGPASFDYYTIDGSARASDNDYQPTSGRLDLPVGETLGTITVPVFGDSAQEGNEVFTLFVAHPNYGSFLAVGNILNDDPAPQIAIDDVAVLEGSSGNHVLLVPVRLNRKSASTVQVRYATANGLALAFDDYLPVSGTLSFAPGTVSATIAVTIVGDAQIEPTETFTIRLSDPVSATIGDAVALVTILADDVSGPPAVQVTRPNGGEVFRLGDQEQVAWTSVPDVVIDVYLSRDGGTTFETLGTNLFDVGYAYWVVEGAPTTNALMRVEARNVLGQFATDVSDATFTILGTGASGKSGALACVADARRVAEGVELRWQFGKTADLRAVAVERTEDPAAAWSEVALARHERNGMTVALDADVRTGITYHYRLAAELTSGERVRIALPAVSVEGVPDAAPIAGIRLAPNPSRGSATIAYAVARGGPVRVSVLDVQGRELAVLEQGVREPGAHRLAWEAPASWPRGLYFVRCATQEGVRIGRLVLTR
jgi:hypothetical protein